METKFQTSFIPKKPLLTQSPIAHTRHQASLSMVIAVFLFVLSLAGAGFVILWEKVLVKAQEDSKAKLSEIRNQFNPELIEELKRANVKIDLSKQLLRNHLASSEVFDIVSKLTIESVRFKSFEFNNAAGSKDASKDGIRLTMKGEGSSFSSIAFQSDVLGKSTQYGTNKLMKNPIISDLTVDQNGRVAFSLSAQISPIDLSYERMLSAAAGDTLEPPADDGSEE